MEVAQSRQDGGNDEVGEFIHLVAAQCDLEANLIAFTQLKAGDGIFGGRLDWLLASDLAQRISSYFHGALVILGFTETTINNNFFEAWHLVRVLEAKFLLQLFGKLIVILRAETSGRGRYWFSRGRHYLISFPLLLYTRVFLPSSLTL